jgi:hypothetical protein
MHALSGIRTHDRSVRASENSSCLHRSATVTGMERIHEAIMLTVKAEAYCIVYYNLDEGTSDFYLVLVQRWDGHSL